MKDRGGRQVRLPRSSFFHRHRGAAGLAPAARLTTLVALLATTLLAGCTPPGLPAPIAPAASSAGGSFPAVAPSVTIGVDGAVQGFNPHAISDYSLADSAVAGLVLPSVSSVAADGTVTLNTDVVRKATVTTTPTSTGPFTVTYTLDRNASWSDGTPITAEDFSYLRDQMLVQPGTVDPAGYRLITGIVSKDAGKTVQVTFAQAVADWKTLFSPLLPSHILKDSPGGWTEGLAAGLPVSGNRYKMLGYDAVTGEITLVRNDKYWGTQPGPGTAVVRIGTSAALIAALHRGDLQAVLLQPNAADQQTLGEQVPASRRVVVPLPGTVQLVLNTVTGATADLQVRRAVAAAIDTQALRVVLDGGNTGGGAAANSLVTLGAGIPGPTAGTSAALADLAGAGYHRESLYMSKGGRILRLALTYSSLDPRMAAAAKLVQRQLAVVGIEVDLVRDDPRTMVNGRMALGVGDLGLVMVPRGPSDALAAGSAFGCPLTPTAGTPVNRAEPLPRAGNLSGLCLSELETLLARSATGQGTPAIDPVVSAALPVIQISRPSAIFAVSAPLAPIAARSGPGWVFSGPLAGLASWPLH